MDFCCKSNNPPKLNLLNINTICRSLHVSCPWESKVLQNVSRKSQIFENFTIHDFTKFRAKINKKEGNTTKWRKNQKSRNLPKPQIYSWRKWGAKPLTFLQLEICVFLSFLNFWFFSSFCCISFFCVDLRTKIGEIMMSKIFKNG